MDRSLSYLWHPCQPHCFSSYPLVYTPTSPLNLSFPFLQKNTCSSHKILFPACLTTFLQSLSSSIPIHILPILILFLSRPVFCLPFPQCSHNPSKIPPSFLSRSNPILSLSGPSHASPAPSYLKKPCSFGNTWQPNLFIHTSFFQFRYEHIDKPSNILAHRLSLVHSSINNPFTSSTNLTPVAATHEFFFLSSSNPRSDKVVLRPYANPDYFITNPHWNTTMIKTPKPYRYSWTVNQQSHFLSSRHETFNCIQIVCLYFLSRLNRLPNRDTLENTKTICYKHENIPQTSYFERKSVHLHLGKKKRENIFSSQNNTQ